MGTDSCSFVALSDKEALVSVLINMGRILGTKSDKCDPAGELQRCLCAYVFAGYAFSLYGKAPDLS